MKKSKKIKNTPHYTTKIHDKLITDLDKEYNDLVEARLVKNGNFRGSWFPPHLQYKTYPDELPNPEDLYDLQTYTSSNPFRQVGRYDERKYFKKNVIAVYNGYCDVGKKVIDSVWKHLKLKPDGKYTIDDIKSIRKEAKFPKKLINSVLHKVNSRLPFEEISKLDVRKMFWYFGRFTMKSKDILGKKVRYNANILFRLMRLIGKNPDTNNFPLTSDISNENTEQEIKTVFEKLGWDYKPM